ncbi:MAG: glycosyltransferase family 2 protein [Spartobacteria bacterium]|nr:glycosyltransferase family 2 protein [Spartobacteria bacterium]
MTESGNKYAIVIPAYQEEEHIGAVIRCAKKYCDLIIVVDDGSTDQTRDVAEENGALLLRHAENFGKGAALSHGFKEAISLKCTAVITVDADGQHDPDEIPKFIEAYERTHIPVLIGNRMNDCKGMPLTRRCTNTIMSYYLSREMGQFVPDTQCGFRLYQCDILQFIAANAPRFAAESEILLHIAARHIRVDSVCVTTIYSGARSKIHPFRDTVRFFSMMREYKKRQRVIDQTRSFRRSIE